MTSKYTNKNGVKLLAAVAVLALAVCSFAVIVTDQADAEGNPTEISDAKGFTDALSAGGSYVLADTISDVTISDNDIVISSDLTIDLKGYTLNITSSDNSRIVIGVVDTSKAEANPVTLTIKSTSTEKGKLTFNGFKDASVSAFRIGAESSLIIENVDYVTNGSAIFANGNSSSVSVKDSNITAGCYAIGTNANYTYRDYAINVNVENSTIIANGNDSDNDTILINVPNATLTVKNSTIKGDRQAVVIRCGTATFENSIIEITKNYTTEDPTPWETGNEVASAALVVGSKDISAYTGTAKVTIDGGKIVAATGKKAVVTAAEKFGEDSSSTIDLAIGKKNATEISIGENKISVTGLSTTTAGLSITPGSIVIGGTTEVTDGKIVILSGVAELTDDVPTDMEIVINKGAALVVDSEITNAGTIINNGSMEVNKKITSDSGKIEVGDSGSIEFGETGSIVKTEEGKVVEVFPDYDVGSTVTVDEITYTVFKGTSGKVEIQYGISCGDVPYTGKPITKYNVNLYSIPLTAGYSLTNQSYDLDPAQTYRNAGTYTDAVMVQLTFSDGTRSITMNEIIDLVIVPAVPDVDFSIEAPASDSADYEWNMYNTVITDDKITYTYNDVEYTFGVNSPAGVTVTYTITKDSVAVEKKISELGEGTYNIALSFTEYGNYAATTTTEKTLKVTKTPDESKIIFKDIGAETNLLGKVASQLQEGVEFTVKDKGGDGKYPVTFSGQFIKVTDYTGFSSVVDEQTGYYLAFSIDMTKVTAKTTLKITKGENTKEFTGAQLDGDFVILLGKTFSEASNCSFEMKIDYDGAEDRYDPGTYTVSADTTEVSEIKMVIELFDELNDDVIKITDPLKYLVLPNGAGTEKTFVGWEDENGKVRAAGSVVIISELDDDKNLRIVFKAVYADPKDPEKPVDPEVPEKETGKFVVSTAITDSEAVISVISLDGGYLVDGTEVTVTFSVLEEGFAFGQSVLKSTEVVKTITISDDKPTIENETYQLSEILGDKYAVISVISTVGTTNFGNMTLNYRA